MRVAIYGAGGLGAVTVDILRAQGVDIGGFYDDVKTEPVLGLSILGAEADLGHDRQVNGVVIALGDGYAERRAAVARRLQEVGVPVVSAIHPQAAVSPLAEVGPGSILCAGAVVNPRSVLGPNCVAFSGAIVEHDCRIGANCFLSPRATLCGYVTVGSHGFLGAGCVVVPDIRLGENVTVGAGAVVLSNVPDRQVVAGVPARLLRVKDRLSYY